MRKKRVWGLLLVVALTLSMCVSCSDDDDSADLFGSNSNKKEATHVGVDLGTGVKWATCNMGAAAENDIGGYYSWGELSPKTTFSTASSLTTGVSLKDFTGDATYDAARANWGGTWRTPTEYDWINLYSVCTFEYASQGGVPGLLITGNNGNSIFLPAGGYYYYKDSSLCYAGEYGVYWTTSPNSGENDNSFSFRFCLKTSSGKTTLDSYDIKSFARAGGAPIRPVMD